MLMVAEYQTAPFLYEAELVLEDHKTARKSESHAVGIEVVTSDPTKIDEGVEPESL